MPKKKNFLSGYGEFPKVADHGVEKLPYIFFIQGTLVFQGPLEILVQRRCNSGIDHVLTKDVCLNFWRSDLQASGIVVWFGLSPWSVRFLF